MGINDVFRINEVQNAFLAYCGLDKLAIVKFLEKLKKSRLEEIRWGIYYFQMY